MKSDEFALQAVFSLSDSLAPLPFAIGSSSYIVDIRIRSATLFLLALFKQKKFS